MAIKEHLLLGSEIYDTIETACGRTPIKIHDSWCVGSGQAFPEVEYVRIRQVAACDTCKTCEAAWRKICRARNKPFVPTARDVKAKKAKAA